MTAWIVIACVSLATFLLRASFIVFVDAQRFPGAFKRALAFVPPAVLAAIVAPGLMLQGDAVDLSLYNVRLVAGLVAIVATIFVRNATAAIAAGMGTLWLLQWLTRLSAPV